MAKTEHIKIGDKVHLINMRRSAVFGHRLSFDIGTKVQTVYRLGAFSDALLEAGGNKQYRAIRLLSIDSVIRCKTEKEWNDLMQALEKIGYKWNASGAKATVISYSSLYDCIKIYEDGGLVRGAADFYRSDKSMKVITYGYLFGDEPLESNNATEEPVEPQTDTVTNEPMTQLTQTQKDQLPEAMQAQVLADLRNADLTLTPAGEYALKELLAKKFEKQLTAAADTIIEDREKASA